MRIRWCWRCRCEMPMLDEVEWALVERARYRAACGFWMEGLPEEGAPVVERRPGAFGFAEVSG